MPAVACSPSRSHTCSRPSACSPWARIKPTLPHNQPLPIEQRKLLTVPGGRGGEVVSVEPIDEPVLHSTHRNLLCPKLRLQAVSHLGRLEQRESVIVNRVTNDEVFATITQFMDQPLNLFDAIQFCTHW